MGVSSYKRILPMANQDKLIDFEDVRRKMGNRSRSACYEDIKHGRLPKPIKIGRKLYWSETIIDVLIAKLHAQANGDQLSIPKPEAVNNVRHLTKK